MATIGEKIRLARLYRGYSQENMASMLNISPTSYRKLEKSTKMKEDKLQQIADKLQVSKEYIEAQGEFGVVNSFNNNQNNGIIGIVSPEQTIQQQISRIKDLEIALERKIHEIEKMRLEREKEVLEIQLLKMQMTDTHAVLTLSHLTK